MINGLTFYQFCNELKGYKFKNKNGFEVFKFQLYHTGIPVSKLLTHQTKYKFELRPSEQC